MKQRAKVIEGGPGRGEAIEDFVVRIARRSVLGPRRRRRLPTLKRDEWTSFEVMDRTRLICDLITSELEDNEEVQADPRLAAMVELAITAIYQANCIAAGLHFNRMDAIEARQRPTTAAHGKRGRR